MSNKTKNEAEDLPAIAALRRWQAGATTVKELIEMYNLQEKK